MSSIQRAKERIIATGKPPTGWMSGFTFDVPFFSSHQLVVTQPNYLYNFSVLWEHFKPRSYLVIGVLVGSAEAYAMYRTKHIPSRTVVCDIDLSEYNAERTNLASAYKNIGKYVGDNEFIVIRSNSKKTHSMRKLGPYDLIFIDGEHSAEAVINDLDHAAASLFDNGVILVHDIDMPGCSVRKGYGTWLRNHPRMKHVEIPDPQFQSGLGMVCKG